MASNLQLHIEGLCNGNLLEEEAINISNIFTNIFSVEPLSAEFRHQERVLCLPSGASLIRSVRVKNDLEVNSVVEVLNFLSFASYGSYRLYILLLVNLCIFLFYHCCTVDQVARCQPFLMMSDTD